MKNPDSNIKYHIAEIINLGPQAQYFTRGRAQVYPSTQLGEAKLEPGFLGRKWVHKVMKRLALLVLLWVDFYILYTVDVLSNFLLKVNNTFCIFNNENHYYHYV